jgi:hypothetical protein
MHVYNVYENNRGVGVNRIRDSDWKLTNKYKLSNALEMRLKSVNAGSSLFVEFLQVRFKTDV